MPWYLDTSAFLKLAVLEDHSEAMRAWADAEEERSGALWSSDLLRTEAVRAARRVSSEAVLAVRDRLDRVAFVEIVTDTFQRAAELDPLVVRSLDAIHLAAALHLGDDLDGVVTYDGRMEEAARILGVAVAAPQ